ncbi:MAG: twin-arginine translocation signal domain-containing protein [Bacteroidales bacterium]|nr:twin-arginine translocation signal domain-containing protein [Bacteroidales bacterium]
METSRRNFLKTMGIATAAAAVFNPANLFANNPAKRNKRGGSSKLELAWENFTGEMKYTFTISGSSRSSTPIVITRLTWDGYTGYGEAAMPPYLGETQASVHEFLKKVVPVLEKFDNPFQIEDILIAVDAIATNNTAAKAAVDIALHDLVGNIIGQPWWKIWGFNPNNTPLTSYTIGYDASDDVVYEKIEEASWTKVIKVKLGMSEKEDKRMINLIRSKTDTVICIDANQGWKDKYYALDMINWLAERNVNMIEQPMPKYWLDDAAWVTERSPLPVIADEACQRLIDVPKLKGAYHGINIKLMKCTGMREAREMVSMANSLRMKLMIGCMTETSVAISAAAQLSPKMEWADLDGNVLIANDCFDGMKLNEGRITLEDKPGLGLTKKKGIIKL